METSQMISSVGHPTNTNEDDTVEENELRETFQIQVGPGDAITGISPHVGRLGVGYSPIKNWSINIEGEANSSQFYRGDENNSANIKVPGYFLLNIRSEYTIPKTINGAQSTLFLQARNILDENSLKLEEFLQRTKSKEQVIVVHLLLQANLLQYLGE